MRRTVTESVTLRTLSWWRQWFVRLHRLLVTLPRPFLMWPRLLVSVATPLWKSHSLPLILRVFTPHFSLFVLLSLYLVIHHKCSLDNVWTVCFCIFAIMRIFQIDAFNNVTVASEVFKWEDYIGIKLHNACMLVPACNCLCSIKLLFAFLCICVFLGIFWDGDAPKLWPKIP